MEEQVSVLQTHAENLQSDVERLKTETDQARASNNALQQHLNALKLTLATNLSSVVLPGFNETLTLDNVDVFMAKLHSLILDAPEENESLIATVRDVISRLSFPLEPQ